MLPTPAAAPRRDATSTTLVRRDGVVGWLWHVLQRPIRQWVDAPARPLKPRQRERVLVLDLKHVGLLAAAEAAEQHRRKRFTRACTEQLPRCRSTPRDLPPATVGPRDISAPVSVEVREDQLGQVRGDLGVELSPRGDAA